MFEGVLPALITPFNKDYSINENGFRDNVAFVENGGISGIVPCGTTGESATLSTAEHEQLIDLSVDCANVSVIAGTGSNNTAEAIELTKYADDAGVDGALIISPYYNKPNNAGLIKHFKSIAESVNIPLLLYNVPTRTSQDMPLEVILELSKVDNIVGIKEASGSLDKVSQIIENTTDEDFSIISGDDGLTFPIITLGGSAVISVVANIVPKRMVDLYDSAKNGDTTTARNIHYELAPLIRALFNETNPIPVKCAAGLIGLASGPLRLPLAPISSDNERILTDALKNIGAL